MYDYPARSCDMGRFLAHRACAARAGATADAWSLSWSLTLGAGQERKLEARPRFIPAGFRFVPERARGRNGRQQRGLSSRTVYAAKPAPRTDA